MSQRSILLPAVSGRGLPLLLALASCAPKNLSIGPVDLDASAVDASSKDTGAPPTDVTRPDTTVASDVPEVDIYVDVPVVIDLDQPLADVASDRVNDAPRPLDASAADGGPLPNLIPVISNPQIQERTYLASSCEVMEGCTVAGNRRLLRFDLSTPQHRQRRPLPRGSHDGGASADDVRVRHLPHALAPARIR